MCCFNRDFTNSTVSIRQPLRVARRGRAQHWHGAAWGGGGMPRTAAKAGSTGLTRYTRQSRRARRAGMRCDAWAWANESRWGFQPYSANLSRSPWSAALCATRGCALQFTIGLNKKGQPQAPPATLSRAVLHVGIANTWHSPTRPSFGGELGYYLLNPAWTAVSDSKLAPRWVRDHFSKLCWTYRCFSLPHRASDAVSRPFGKGGAAHSIHPRARRGLYIIWFVPAISS